MRKNLEEKSAFVICPVREATSEERDYILEYISKLEAEGYRVHYPARDTNQNDTNGLRICTDNREAIKSHKEVHVYWNGKSTGSLFDFGMAFMAGKPIIVFNRDYVKTLVTNGKSFHNVLLALDEKYRTGKI